MDEVTSEVSEGVTTPEGEPANTPEAGEGSQSSEKTAGEVEVQLSPKAQQRMQKLANEAKEAKRWKSEYDKVNSQYVSSKDARELDTWLRADQKRAQAFVEWAKAQENPQPQEDPYAQFAPEVADKFRKLDALEAWQKQQEQQAYQGQQTYIQQNQSKLDEHFDSLLRQEGFADESGKINDELSAELAGAVMSRLQKQGDPRLATEKQVDEALKGVLKGLASLEKRALKKAVKQPGVPASGTGVGKSVDRKIDWSNPENRIAHLATAMKG